MILCPDLRKIMSQGYMLLKNGYIWSQKSIFSVPNKKIKLDLV